MTDHVCPRRQELGSTSVFKLPESDTWREDETCSYCGSLNPDKFMTMLESGQAKLVPTDKSYKVYVDYDIGSGKFYFQHLSVEQRKRFIELLNEKKFDIGHPGHFYVLPFFCTL